VITRELHLSPELIARAVREAAAALPAATRELRVHVHPADLALLHELGAAESHWQLLADPSLARGDCQLESERSRLDARVETRLAAVIDAVLGDDTDGSGE
jgi:flagellar assembly protein FliH